MLVILFTIGYLLIKTFIGVHLYLWIKTFKDPFRWKKGKVIFGVIYGIMTSLIFLAYFLPNSLFKTLIARTSNYYQGLLINVSMAIILAHLIALILKVTHIVPKDFFKKNRNRFITGWICLSLGVGFSLYGFINANHIEKYYYDVSVDKQGEDMKIVLIADTHLGYSYGVRNVRNMVDKINEESPDLVCIAGDIFDNDYDAMDDPEGIRQALSSINSKYGVFACWGNHDIKDKLFGGFTVSTDEEKVHDDRMEQLLRSANITLLQDEVMTVDNKFTILGRLDLSKPATHDNSRMAISDFKFDKSKLVIDVDHEPKELQETADAGVDLDLCGHTHNGQFFPLTIPIKFIWENAAGLIEKTSSDGSHKMYNVVTQGVGVYGPFMRTLTDSEISVVNVHMNNGDKK